MRFKDLVEIIEEEIYLELLDRMISSNNAKGVVHITEMLDIKEGMGFGRKWRKRPKKDDDLIAFRSAGTVGGESERKRKLTDPQIAKRKEIGKRLLNAMRGGVKDKNNPKGYEKKRLALQEFIKKWAKNSVGGRPTRDELLSFLWAFATVLAYEGFNDWQDYFDLNFADQQKVFTGKTFRRKSTKKSSDTKSTGKTSTDDKPTASPEKDKSKDTRPEPKPVINPW
jgi:hypothetical protein